MKSVQIFGLFIFLMYFCTTRKRNVADIAQWQSTSLVGRGPGFKSRCQLEESSGYRTGQPLFSCTQGKKARFGTIFRPDPDRSGRAPQTTQIQVYPHLRCASSSDVRHAINRSGTINRKGGRESSHISGILLFRVRLRSFISKRALQYRIAQFTKRD